MRVKLITTDEWQAYLETKPTRAEIILFVEKRFVSGTRRTKHLKTARGTAPQFNRVVRGPRRIVYLRYHLPFDPSHPVSLSTGLFADSEDLEQMIQPFIDQAIEAQKAALRSWLDVNAFNQSAPFYKNTLRYLLRFYPEIYKEKGLK